VQSVQVILESRSGLGVVASSKDLRVIGEQLNVALNMAWQIVDIQNEKYGAQN
jgi:hypothetical protein